MMENEIKPDNDNLSSEQIKNIITVLLAGKNIGKDDINDVFNKINNWNDSNNQLSVTSLRERIDLLFSELEIVKVTHVLHEAHIKDNLIGNVLIYNDSQEHYCIMSAKYYNLSIIDSIENEKLHSTTTHVGWKYIDGSWYKLFLPDETNNKLHMVRFSSKWDAVNIKFENKNFSIVNSNKFVLVTKNFTTIIPIYSQIKLDVFFSYIQNELKVHAYGEDINEVYEKMLLNIFEQLNINLTSAHYNIINKGSIHDVIDIVLSFDEDYLQSSIVIGDHSLFHNDRSNDINHLYEFCENLKSKQELECFKTYETQLLTSKNINKIYNFYQVNRKADVDNIIQNILSIADKYNINCNNDIDIALKQLNNLLIQKNKLLLEVKYKQKHLQMVDFWTMIIDMKYNNSSPNVNLIKNIIQNTSYAKCNVQLTEYIMHLWENMNVAKPNITDFTTHNDMLSRNNLWKYMINNISNFKNPYSIKIFNTFKTNPNSSQEIISQLQNIVFAIHNKDKPTTVYLITLFVINILNMKYKVVKNNNVDLNTIIAKLKSTEADNNVDDDNSTYSLLALIKFFETVDQIQPDLHLKIFCKGLLMSAGTIGLMKPENISILDILNTQIQHLLHKKTKSQQIYCSNEKQFFIDVLNLKIQLPAQHVVHNNKQFRVNNNSSTCGMIKYSVNDKIIINMFGNCIVTQPDTLYDVEPSHFFDYEYNPSTCKLKVPNVNNTYIYVKVDDFIISNQFKHMTTIDGSSLKMSYSNIELRNLYKLQDKILNINNKFATAQEENHIQLLQNKYNIRQRPM